jgi:hypothetical protein
LLKLLLEENKKYKRIFGGIINEKKKNQHRDYWLGFGANYSLYQIIFYHMYAICQRYVENLNKIGDKLE